MGSSRIPLYVSNGKAYVWTAEDVSILRTQHRICGTLIGTLPHLTQQNFFLGLPLLLMPEEVVLLLEKGVCTLVDDAHSVQEPTHAELTNWAENKRQAINTQINQWRAKEYGKSLVTSVNELTSEVTIAKQRERRTRPKSVPGSRSLHSLPNALDFVAPPVADTFTLTIPSASTDLAWYQPRRYNTLESARDSGLWMYPLVAYERTCCRIFHDLWERGYYIGGGIKFGGEYLVYPGDPLRYHSHFVTSILASPDTLIRPMEIVAHGRLATGTKKTQLFCTWKQENDTVLYYSVDWAGFG